jgi:polysaccharide pyruvyl transferase WcaK-like protein
MPLTRRRFLQTTLASTLIPALARAAGRDAPRILLRSSWQVVNIGDIAHTPGVLALIERHLPDAQVRLWASSDLSAEVAAMEHRRFPNLKIVKGSIGEDGRASNDELADALVWTDFLLHGSGPSMVATRDVAAFDRHVGKPYGIYGITYSNGSPLQRDLLTRAQFAYFRDTESLEAARSQGVRCPVMEFGPDGAFACDLRNDEAAERFLAEHDLVEGEFLCCIPRLRYTPYWRIRENRAFDETRHRRNEQMKEHDHAPLREAITAVVREGGKKVLVCPEDMTQMQVGKEMLVDPLPDDVRRQVVWRENFWLTDEALSTYVRSAGIFGLEMHSPIMCIGNGVPAIVCRFEEQTSKGFMWRDIGLGDWLFDMDTPDEVARIVPTVMSLITDRDAALQKVGEAQKFVTKRQRETMEIVGREARVAQKY